jgi:hypothetical protein
MDGLVKENDMSANCRTAVIDLKFRCNITWFLQKKWARGGGALTLNCVITATERTDGGLSYQGQKQA